MSSYDYRTTIVRLSYGGVRFTYDLASHQAIIVKSYAIIRLSYDYRSTFVRCRTINLRFHRDYDASQPIVSSVTTKLRLQYRSRIGGKFINLRCHPSHDIAARCDQGFTEEIILCDSTCSRNMLCDCGWGIYVKKGLSIYVVGTEANHIFHYHIYFIHSYSKCPSDGRLFSETYRLFW